MINPPSRISSKGPSVAVWAFRGFIQSFSILTWLCLVVIVIVLVLLTFIYQILSLLHKTELKQGVSELFLPIFKNKIKIKPLSSQDILHFFFILVGQTGRPSKKKYKPYIFLQVQGSRGHRSPPPIARRWVLLCQTMLNHPCSTGPVPSSSS